ncbi:undecaprenyldiphospho-muramoylpentapeptide beta-N-acetylglucosaminyltransferase [Powellomyces hirtus]|uniref:UDP-N-acetylglucosamine transferase subunit ALG13 n=1 Tax=Powellomyces hirtus TaxID=109895 RepID=A0A507DXB3_9FUNG|nr:undecaprenyldiphospho-muramoylpentapeptide beta-N-acetylglucosaminyltransferase [Powellomyces hirtus]
MDEKQLNIGFYITGHGFGHATRATVTIHRLLTLGHRVTIISSTPTFIYQDLLSTFPHTCALRNIATLDPGVAQKDAVTVDVDVTMDRLRTFLDGMEGVAQQEAEWMRGEGLDVVCLDAPFLPARVAKEVGIPSVMITNFTFDAIFDAIALTPSDKALVARCAEMYTHTSYLIRIPGHISIPAFTAHPSRIIDVPLIVRKSKLTRDNVRAILDIPLTAPCVLITFGGFELSHSDGDNPQHVLPDGWYGLIASPRADTALSRRLRRICAEKWYMPDLINAADVVVGKCGYGTCSEVVAHGVPLVYVPRSGFAEEEGLVENLMKPYGYAVQMPQRHFYEGRWEPYILQAAAMKKKYTPRAIDCDGEVEASRIVVDLARGRRL